MYRELMNYANQVKEPHLRALLKDLFVDDAEFVKAFKFHSAAKTVHHSFVGGLLEHTLSVCRLCEYYTKAYPFLNRDLLYTAAMCHDIGKVYELSDFPENDYTDEGQLLGHIAMGSEMVGERARRIAGFPKKLENELKHCILAHHGELEYGSPKKPALAEAMALNLADNTDAKMETLKEIFKSAGRTRDGWATTVSSSRICADDRRMNGGRSLKKNDLLEIKIETMGNAGEGIGKIDGYPLFVKDALPGDTARVRLTKVKKTYAYARLEELLEASPYRTKPRCPLHRSCGGCQIQALSYEKQLEYKENKVRQDLIRIGGFSDPPVLPVLGMEEPYHYRNKAQFPFGRDREGRVVTGFYAGRTHTIVPGTDCAIGVPENKEILETILDFMKEKGVEPYDETTGKGLLRHALLRKAFATGELMVCLVINGRRFPYVEELADRLFAIPGMTSFSLNVNQKNTNVILGEEVIPVRGQTYITDQIGGIRYRSRPFPSIR